MTDRMAQIVDMGKLGGFVALLDGRMQEFEGRILWPDPDSLAEAAHRAGVVTSSHRINTRSVVDIPPPSIGMTLVHTTGAEPGAKQAKAPAAGRVSWWRPVRARRLTERLLAA